MNTHTDLINYLVTKFSLNRYLEIGINNTANNFDLIKATDKVGVDPNFRSKATFCGTSDEYFLAVGDEVKFDMVFIDGLHHADQVQRDFENSLAHLSDGGFILLHDTCPEKEELTKVPRNKKGRWLGDVYKFVLRLNTYTGIDFCTLDFDNGCTVVWKDEYILTAATVVINNLEPITWNVYKSNQYLMRFIHLKNFFLIK